MKRLLFILVVLCVMYGGSANASLPRFVDLQDGTVVDTVSKLRWLKNADCFGSLQTWVNAVSSGANLTAGSCGLTDGSVAGDWRLPTIDELRILPDAGYRDNSLNTAGFTGVKADYYWSGTTVDNFTNIAWYVYMSNGIVSNNYKTHYMYVWPVRSGQFDYLASVGPLVFNQSSQAAQDINLGAPSHTEFSIINGGAAASSFSSQISGTNSAEFSVAPGGTSPCSSISPTLDAGASCTLLVTATPTTKGAKTAQVSITSSSITNSAGRLSIPLTATGITTIMGNITDLSTGNKLAAATISITGGATTQSNTAGVFTFSQAPANGVYTVTITKTGYGTATINNVTISDTAGATLKVGMAPSGILNFTTASGPLYHAETGTAYNQSVKITGGATPYIFSKAYGSLPSGLSIDPTLGTISGTPTTVGSYAFAMGVTDQLGAYAELEFSIEVTEPLAISSTTLPRGTSSLPYSYSISSIGGKAPYSYQFSGSLPFGINSSNAGILNGTPSCQSYVCTKWEWSYSRGAYWCASYGWVASACIGTESTETVNLNVSVTDASGRISAKDFTLSIDQLLANTTPRLHDGIVGAALNQTLTAIGGLAPYTWGIYSGTLPAGLTLDPATGIISGTPTSATSQPVVIALQDSYSRVVYKQFTINSLSPLQILTTAMPNGSQNNIYSEAIRTNGGIGPYNFALTGQLPAGLTLNATTGVVSGTPTATGLTNLQVTVTDSSYPTPLIKTQNLSIRVTSSVTITTSAVLTNAKKGFAITPVTLVAKGGLPGYTWSIIDGSLPSGVTFNLASGIFSGTPADRGDFSFTVRVTDSVGNATGPSATPPNPDKQFILHVSDTISVTTGAVPNGAVGLPYSATLSATGGLKNYSWAVKTGTLPSGLSLSSDGTISGTPSANITSSVTFEVTDSDAPAQKAQVTLIFVITDQLSIYEGSIPNSRINQAYSANIRAQLGTPPYSWSITSGTLPAGVTLTQNAGTAVLSGTPTAAGTASFTLEVHDNGTPVQTVSRAFTSIVYPDVVIPTASLKTAIRGVAYSDIVAATGGLLPYTFRLTAGTLPSGLVFNSSTGAVTGSVTMATGTSATFTVTVTDSGYPSASVSKQFTIMAVDPLSINTSVIQGALQKSSYSATFDGQGGVAPLTWSLANGSFPASMNIDPQTGILAGTTPVCGTFNFTLQLTDSSAVPMTLQKSFQLQTICSNDYDLSGGIGIADVTVALAGNAARTVSTDINGNYLFQHLTNGNYTLTPARTGYWFTPDSRSITLNNLDMSGASFVATVDTTPPIGTIVINAGATYTKAAAVVLGLNATDVGSGVVSQMQLSSDNGTTWLAAENYTQSRNWTVSTGDGSKTISVKFKDKAGNWSSVYSTAIILDTMPPDTEIESKPANPSNNPAPSIGFTATEPNSTFECKLDSGAFASCTTPKAYIALTEGIHTFEVRAIDPAGNSDQTAASYSWTIDLTPPDTTISSKPATPTNSQAPSFNFTATESNSTFECKMDSGAFTACTTPKAYSALNEGNHVFEVRAIDPAGNTDTTPTNYSWTIDLTPPDVAITSQPVNPNSQKSGSFIFSSTDTTATFECKLDNGNFADCTSPYSYTNFVDGTNTFSVRAKDPAGNLSATSATYTWVTDSTAPAVTGFTVPATGTTLTVTVTTLTATDNVAVTGYLLTESATAPSTAASNWSGTALTSYTFSNFPDGIATAKTLYAWAKDAAGNVSSSATATTSITLPDVTKPTVTTFTIPATGTALTVAVTALTATDNVAVTGYLLTETTTSPTPAASGWSGTAPTSYTFSSFPDGIATPKTLYVWAKDAAGNVSASATATTTITLPDVTKPGVSGFTLPATGTTLTVAVTTLTATDNIAVTGYLLTETTTLPTAAASGWSGTAPTSYEFSSFPDGLATPKTLYAWAKDASGNVSSSATATTTITLPDVTKPAVSGFMLPATGTTLALAVTTFTATDNIAVTGYLLTETATAPTAAASGWSGTAPTSYEFSSFPDGLATPKTLYAWAKDEAGNVSSSATATTTITLPDVTAPGISNFAIPTSAALIVPVTSFTATDNVAVTGYCIIDINSATACNWSSTAPASFTFATAGPKTLYAWAKDNADNLSASVAATVTVTSKPGDCDNSGEVSIAEAQSAVNMFLKLKTVAGCVDTSGDGNASIAEVQKVINGFLRL